MSDIRPEGMTLVHFPTEVMRATAEMILDGALGHAKEDDTSLWVDLRDREKVVEVTEKLRDGWWVLGLDYPAKGQRRIVCYGAEGGCRDAFLAECAVVARGTVLLTRGNVQVEAQRNGVRIRRFR